LPKRFSFVSVAINCQNGAVHSVKARKNLLESAGLNERKDVIGPGQADTPPSGQTDQQDRPYYTPARTSARQHGGRLNLAKSFV
jgi:hypothetical protein